MSRDGCVALPRGAMGLYAVCDWYFLIILTYYSYVSLEASSDITFEFIKFVKFCKLSSFDKNK